MYRARLKTRSGCLICRKRRKKCDDRKPRCTECLRLRLTCEWETDTGSASAPDQESSSEAINQSLLDTTATTTTKTAKTRGTNTTRSTQRVADHDGLDRRGIRPSSGYMMGWWNFFEPHMEEVAPTAMEEMRHTLIVGIFQGWDQIPQTVRTHDMWSRVILLDGFLQSIGQGKAARLAMMTNGLALMQVSHVELRTASA